MGLSSRRAELGQLYSLLSGYWNRICIGISLILTSTLISLAYPLVIAKLVDGAILRGGRGVIFELGIVLLVLFLTRSVSGFLGGFILEQAGENVVNSLRKRLFRSLLCRDMDFHSTQRIGDLSSRLHADTASVRDAVTQSIVSAINQSFMFLGSIAVMVAVNWRLTIIVLAVAPLSALVSARAGPHLEEAARNVRARAAAALANASESLLGIETVLLLNLGTRQGERYGRDADAMLTSAVRFTRLSSLFGAVLSLLSSVVTVALFVFGGQQVLAGALSAGALVAFLFYAEGITQSVSVFSVIYANLLSALGSSAKVFELLGEGESRCPDTRHRSSPSISTYSLIEPRCDGLAVKDVCFSYASERHTLTDVSFSVPSGGSIGIVGKSGCGKSTLASLLCRLRIVDSGAIFLNCADTSRVTNIELRQKASLVSQSVFLFDDTIFENIRCGRPEASDAEVEAVAKEACLVDLLTILPQGYQTMVGERGAMLSGGQKQRIAIARALLRKPALLILDEATSALDVGTEAMVMRNIASRCRSDRICLVVITHRASVMKKMDKLLVLESGVAVSSGRFDDLWGAGGALDNVFLDETSQSCTNASSVDPESAARCE